MGTLGVLENAESEFQSYTSQTSTVNRSLGLASIAIIWLYAGGASSNASFGKTVAAIAESKVLFAALVCSVLALALDLLQYAVASLLWGSFRTTLISVLKFDDWKGGMTERAAAAWKTRYGAAYAKRIANTEVAKAVLSGGTAVETARCCIRRMEILQNSANLSDADVKLKGQLSEVLEEPWSPPGLEAGVYLVYIGKTILVVGSYVCLIVRILAAG